MEFNRIEKISKIDGLKLDSEHYFESLLEQGYTLGVLFDAEIQKIQLDCLSILAKQTQRYNSDYSSSIKIETAQGILSSIMFTIGVALKTYERPDDAITALQGESLETLYQKGRKQIDRMLQTSKLLHARIIRSLIVTPNIFYRSTIVDGIKGFFKLYYPDFRAHEIQITIDYPLYNPVEKLLGIEFVQKYLGNIYYENQFCSNFASDDIHHLLCGYHENYQELLLNIYEQILTTTIGCAICGIDVRRLELDSTHMMFLVQTFTGKMDGEIEEILDKAFEKLSQSFLLAPSLSKYVKASLLIICATISNAARQGTLDRVFILSQYPEDNPEIYFPVGDKMEDEKYCKVIHEMMQCHQISEKIAVIKREIHSFSDLEDILIDIEFEEKELAEIMNALSPMEIAALMKKYPSADEADRHLLRGNEVKLCGCLHDFVNLLPNEQKGWLEKAVNMLTWES